MLEGPKRGASQVAILSAIARAGDPRVSLLEAGGGEYAFLEQQVSDGIGCDGHPSVATHRIMAGMLIEGIRRVTGW
jgi:hypothetical protein